MVKKRSRGRPKGTKNKTKRAVEAGERYTVRVAAMETVKVSMGGLLVKLTNPSGVNRLAVVCLPETV